MLIPLLYALLALGEAEAEEEVEEAVEEEAEVLRMGRERDVGREGMDDDGMRELAERKEGEWDRTAGGSGESSEFRSITSTSFSSSSIGMGEGVLLFEEEMVRGSRSARFLSPTMIDAID